MFCIGHTATGREGCALSVHWRKGYHTTTNTFKTLWPPLVLPRCKGRKRKSSQGRHYLEVSLWLRLPSHAREKGSGSGRERGLVAKDDGIMLTGRLQVMRGSSQELFSLRIISKRQAGGKEQLSFDVVFCVHLALLCKYQLTQTEVRMGCFKTQGVIVSHCKCI